MLNIAILGQVARSALVGAVVTKAIDVLIMSKVNDKIDQKRWIKTNKLELFSKLTEEILLFDEKANETKKRTISSLCSKIILLSNNKRLNNSVENYLYQLNQNKQTIMQKENENLLKLLKRDLLQ